MKKIIYSLLVVLTLSFMSAAQDPSAIATMPAQANGYLILNKGFYTNVSSWHVVVKEKIPPVTRNSPPTYVTKLDQMLVEKNYLKIPVAYRNANHFMEITGFEGTTSVVHANESVIGGSSELLCSWVCNGSNYAYALEMNTISSQQGPGYVKISMQDAPPPTDYPFYYQWVHSDDWTTFKLQHDPADYGLTSSWALAETNGTNAIIHLYNVPANNPKHDEFGSAISGHVLGVSKHFGPYRDYQGLINSNPLYVGESECAQPIIWALDRVNQGDDTPVNVVCSGTSYNTGAVDVPYADVADPVLEDYDPCFENYYDYIGWHPGSGSGVYQLIQIPCNWINVVDPGTGTGTGIHWPEHVSRITLKSLFGSVSGDPVTIGLERASLFNEDGDFVGPNYTIPAGFYNVLYQYDDLSIASYFVEVATATESVVADKDFLSYTAYPVPVEDNGFHIDFEASKKVEFTFELRDANNNLLFSDNYTVQKDEPVTEAIQPTVAIPDGMLYCKFTFLDNSVINFTIVK